MEMTPFKLGLLMHFYAHADDPESITSNAAGDAISEFLEFGLITQALGDDARRFKTTIFGDFAVNMILSATAAVLDEFTKAPTCKINFTGSAP